MKIVAAGATGFIGRPLIRLLKEQGLQLTLLSRRPVEGEKYELWDGKAAGGWTAALEGADALINLAGENIAEGRWTEARKKALVDSRLDSTKALVYALSTVAKKPKIFVAASAIGFYGDRGDETLDEGSSAGSGFLAELCQKWEDEARQAEKHGCRVVHLRTGIVLGKGGGALGKMLLPFKLGLGGRLGPGTQWMSWISLEDELGLIRHALLGSAAGALNATAPNPVTNAEFTKTLGRVLHRPTALPAPAFALKLALGEMSEMLLGGQKVLPKKALASGYIFKHPTLETALAAATG